MQTEPRTAPYISALKVDYYGDACCPPMSVYSSLNRHIDRIDAINAAAEIDDGTGTLLYHNEYSRSGCALQLIHRVRFEDVFDRPEQTDEILWAVNHYCEDKAQEILHGLGIPPDVEPVIVRDPVGYCFHPEDILICVEIE
tara:strand:- start:293 stop:715 length:423 start_codon:yes stop_codon:yes gene_type:complete